MTLPPFVNEPTLELRRGPVRESLLEALAELDPLLPVAVPILIGDDRGAADTFGSTDPGTPSRLVGTAGEASSADVDAAVKAAEQAQRAWARTTAKERAGVLVRAAAELRARRGELAALEVRECAKPWAEADADVCEAIDFLEYYARAALELARGRALIEVPGERNTMRYEPRGVTAVIAPWNFPIAIPCGMAAAALVTGNAVVLKPAEQSPACGFALVSALRDAGVPPGVLSLLPGHGEAGAALVRHPGVHVIAFTGSSAVGLDIVRAAAETPEGQDHVKRVVSEMGGKNCVIVDSDADLDEAIPHIAASAFGYAGQKCSAASRALVADSIAGEFIERMAGVVESLVIGQAEVFGTEVPPVIEREAKDRVERYATQAEDDGRVVARGGPLPGAGWFCAPTLAADLAPESPVLSDEIFGPLLSVETVASVEEAAERVSASPFALTGGIFSRDPRTVQRLIEQLPVGNLYVNRGITGAVVGRQPFGGNRRSGVGSKAGGPDYLLQFVEPRVVSENTMRHGLVLE